MIDINIGVTTIKITNPESSNLAMIQSSRLRNRLWCSIGIWLTMNSVFTFYVGFEFSFSYMKYSIEYFVCTRSYPARSHPYSVGCIAYKVNLPTYLIISKNFISLFWPIFGKMDEILRIMTNSTQGLIPIFASIIEKMAEVLRNYRKRIQKTQWTTKKHCLFCVLFLTILKLSARFPEMD